MSYQFHVGVQVLMHYNCSGILWGVRKTPLNGLPRTLTESGTIPTGKPTCFLREVGEAWENAVKPAVQTGLPVTLMRFGVVLKKGGGILGKMALPFSLGAGCILGNGHQTFSWVHVGDLVQAILFLIAHPDMTGPVNIVAPGAVSQREFARTLATTMHRPLFLRMPASLIKLVFGQMGIELLLGGQNIYPERLLTCGFQFQYPDLVSALQAA